MEKIKYVTLGLGLALVLVSALLVSSYINLAPASRHQPLSLKANQVYVTIGSTMGVYNAPVNNIITDIGEIATAQAHGGTTLNCSWISVGNATEAAALTQLTTQYDRIEAADIAYGAYNGDYARNVTATFYFTEDVTLDCAGLHWADSGDNNLWAVANFAQTSFSNNWNMTITWVSIFDGN
jgi:hypothetical protein